MAESSLFQRDGARAAVLVYMIDHGRTKQLMSYPEGQIRVMADSWDSAWKRFSKLCEEAAQHEALP